MKLGKLVTVGAAVLFAASAYSGEHSKHKMEIEVVTDDGDGETRLVLDSDDMDFNLRDMQIGENQSIVDKEGRAVLVTRTDEGYTFNVDGKTIDMPAFGTAHESKVWVSRSGHAPEVDVDVQVAHGSKMAIPVHAPHARFKSDGVMIISGAEIDDTTQQVIRTALESAGHEEVRFVGGGRGFDHQVRVVEKVVEVSD